MQPLLSMHGKGSFEGLPLPALLTEEVALAPPLCPFRLHVGKQASLSGPRCCVLQRRLAPSVLFQDTCKACVVYRPLCCSGIPPWSRQGDLWVLQGGIHRIYSAWAGRPAPVAVQTHLSHSGPAAGAPHRSVPPDATRLHQPIMPQYAALTRHSKGCGDGCAWGVCGRQGLHSRALNGAVTYRQQGRLLGTWPHDAWAGLPHQVQSRDRPA